jgi:hypothetical protein
MYDGDTHTHNLKLLDAPFDAPDAQGRIIDQETESNGLIYL